MDLDQLLQHWENIGISCYGTGTVQAEFPIEFPETNGNSIGNSALYRSRKFLYSPSASIATDNPITGSDEPTTDNTNGNNKPNCNCDKLVN